MASKGVVQPGIRRCTDLAACPTTMIPTCHAARYSQKSTWDMDGRTNGPAGRAVDRWTNWPAAAAAGEQRAGRRERREAEGRRRRRAGGRRADK